MPGFSLVLAMRFGIADRIVPLIALSAAIHVGAAAVLGRSTALPAWMPAATLEVAINANQARVGNEASAALAVPNALEEPSLTPAVNVDHQAITAQLAQKLSIPTVSVSGLLDELTYFKSNQVDIRAEPVQPLAFNFPIGDGLPAIGIVQLEVLVDREGNVTGTNVLSVVPRNERFPEMAIAGLQGARFTPAYLSGRAVNSIKLLEIVFDKDGAPIGRKRIIGVDGEPDAGDWVVAENRNPPK